MERELIMLIIDYIIRGCVIAFFYLGYHFIKKYQLEKWTIIAAKSAEMLYTESGMGEKKKQYVIEFIKAKFKISNEELDRLIESAVWEIEKISNKLKN